MQEFDESGDPENHFQALLSLAKEGIQKGKVVAVGECGLDYDRLHFCPAEVQKKYFEKQFELAHATKLPMFLHMRAAAEDFCEIMKSNKCRFTGGVTHSFTGTAEESNKLLSFKNMYIGEITFSLANLSSALFLGLMCYLTFLLDVIESVNGCSLKTTENLDVVREIPIDIVKSSWPSKKKEKYEPGSIVKGRNEPCLVRQVLEVIAGCKGVDLEEMSRTIYHNTCRIFFPQDLDSAAESILAGNQDSQST
ncbi:Deoxyribonuclease TATDN1 [Linum perenne]